MSAADTRRQRIAIFVTAIAALILTAVLPDEAPPKGRMPPSTFHAREGGAKALYLTARELGLEVGRWMRPARELDDDGPSVLVSLSPTASLDRLEVGDLVDWIEDGGRLIYAPTTRVAFGGGWIETEEDDPLVEALELSVDAAEGVQVRKSPDLPASARALLGDAPATLAFDHVLDVSDVGWNTDASVEAWYVDAEGRAGVALVRRGEGAALVLADADGLANDALSGSEVALIALRAAGRFAGEDGAIAFDELHHGFSEGEGIVAATLAWLAGTRRGWAVLGLAAVVFLAIATSGVRQGRAIPPPPKPRRSSLEHVHALAEAYGVARAVKRPARELALSLRLSLRLPQHAGELEPALDQLRRADPRIEGDVERVLAALRGPVDLVALSRSIDRVRAAAELPLAPPAAPETEETPEGAVA